MFTTIISKLSRSAATGAAALVLSAACIGAAISPAGAKPVAAAPQTLADWQADVSRQLDASDQTFAMAHDNGVSRKAVVAVQLDAGGRFAGATLQRSSGYWTFDRHAIRTVAHLAYPPLPQGLRGQPQTVQVNLLLASRSDMARYEKLAAESRDEEMASARRAAPDQLAAK